MTDTISTSALAGLVDRAAITDTLHRYTAGLDLNDAELLASSLTEDAVVDLGPAMRRIGYDFPALTPRETVVETLIGAVGPLDTSHAVSNIRYDIDGDTATVFAYALANHFKPGVGSDATVTRHALMMNRYTAAMVRDGKRWRIRRLDIANAWFEGDPLMLLGQ
ncbi:nuclear transport factor 2 family protein [Micromonospora sp. WMMD1120]|uniref:nuclear transport factor 2 family protein n=1 Tax=Micromonospora sp. WMMD1120 TaxID=3016106 RepID=UPI002416B252|nr:nuclear transport factor 2 family protein [Micromonospora sp. WMMD1120]MDG4811135.1 nuclear transport factor 2 family protein [Micromonospora sp. WMMD1120]